MTDYQRNTGSSGKMLIRDTGTRIEFWIIAGAQTFDYSMPWTGTINNVDLGARTFRFEPGGSWQMIGSWSVSFTQTVLFHLGATGVSGLGGPTDFRVDIVRATLPGTPTRVVASSLTSTSVRITWTDPPNGGAPIDARQLGFTLVNGGTPTSIISSDKDDVWSGLPPGRTQYFRARVRNSEGWGGWSPQLAVTTLDEPAAPGVVTVTEITQTSVLTSFTDAGSTGGSPILERQIGYTLVNNGTPTNTVTYSGATRISGLQAGRTYYFRSRTRNAVGWSDWSVQTAATLIAGAFVKVGGVWKPAVPYVRVGGVWKTAIPWGRLFGFWEEST